MLKGHVFSKQIFESHIFALFVNTFLNGKNGISNSYKNGMGLTYLGSSITIDSGAVCVQGRLLENDPSSSIEVGTDSAYCKLVIEINLDEINTDTEFKQASFKVIKSTSNYPELTQTNIVKNNSGIYQYELARFETGLNGITDFQDKRTFLDFESIYDEIEKHIKEIDDESIFIKKSDIATIDSSIATTTTSIDASKIINYPDGFNSNNCIVLSLVGIDMNGSSTTPFFSTGLLPYATGAFNLTASLQPSNIVVTRSRMSESEPALDIGFRLVLLKMI